MLEDIKHNKLKNTGIIAEVLIRKVIQEAIDNKKPIAYHIFKKFFTKDKQLGKQLAIYNCLMESKYDDRQRASQLLTETIKLRSGLNEIKLQRQKYLCIKQMKKYYDINKLFSQKIDDYKVYASIYKVFQSLKKQNYNPNIIVESKYQILDYIIKPIKQQPEDSDIEIFKKQDIDTKEKVLQLFVHKFNEKYKHLNERQKALIQKYAYAIDEKEIDEYMDNEIKRLKQSLQKQKDNQSVTKIYDTLNNYENIKNTDDRMFYLLNIYEAEDLLEK